MEPFLNCLQSQVIWAQQEPLEHQTYAIQFGRIYRISNKTSVWSSLNTVQPWFNILQIWESESKHKPLECQASAIQSNSMQCNVMQFCIEAGLNFNYLQAELGDCCKSCLPQPLKCRCCSCWTPLIRDVDKARGAKEEQQEEEAWMLMSRGCRHAIGTHNPNALQHERV